MAALSESELPRARWGSALAWSLASDAALARATAAGADGAFGALFARHHAPIVRYCRSILLDHDDAQDAAQATFASALRALRGDRPQPLALRPWLYAIARHEALAVARRRGAGVAVTTLDAEAAAVAAPDDAAARERFAELLADLRALPERQREALVLRELEGLRHDEIGVALGMTAQAARQAVFEARAALTAIGEGRAAACADVRRALSDGDGRTRRSRALRAHLDGCADCTTFADALQARRRALRALFPLGPGVLALASSGGAATIAGGGAAAGTGAGGWLLAGLGGASVASKCAVLCASVAILGGSLAALEHGPAHRPDRPPSATARATPLPHRAPPAAPRRAAIAAASPAHAQAIVLPAAAPPATARPASPVRHGQRAARARRTRDHAHAPRRTRATGDRGVPVAIAPEPPAPPAQPALDDARARRQAAAEQARRRLQDAARQTVAQAQQTVAHVQQTVAHVQQSTQEAVAQAQEATRQAVTQAQQLTQQALERARQTTEQLLQAAQDPIAAARRIAEALAAGRATEGQ